MPTVTRLLVVLTLLLCGCAEKTEPPVTPKTGKSDSETKSTSKSATDDVSITFYVKGMSDRLNLT